MCLKACHALRGATSHNARRYATLPGGGAVSPGVFGRRDRPDIQARSRAAWRGGNTNNARSTNKPQRVAGRPTAGSECGDSDRRALCRREPG